MATEESDVKPEPISPRLQPTTTTPHSKVREWTETDLINLGRGIDRYGEENWEKVAEDTTLNLGGFGPLAIKRKWEILIKSIADPLNEIKSELQSRQISRSLTPESTPTENSRFLFVNASQFKPITTNQSSPGNRLARRTAPSSNQNLPPSKNAPIYTQLPSQNLSQTGSTGTPDSQLDHTTSQTTNPESGPTPGSILKETLAPTIVTGGTSHIPYKRRAHHTYALRSSRLKFFSQPAPSVDSDLESSLESELSDAAPAENHEVEPTHSPSQSQSQTQTQNQEISDGDSSVSYRDEAPIESPETSSGESGDSSDHSNPASSSKARRRRYFWTIHEEESLRKGVNTYGEGQWAAIRADTTLNIRSRRSATDLKDKWRTICRQSRHKRTRHPTPTARLPRKTWSLDEVKALCEGIHNFGAGNWKQIGQDRRLSSRTPVQLKDKWRNLTASGFKSDVQFFTVMDENHAEMIKDGVPWELLTQDAHSAALEALKHLLPLSDENAHRRKIPIRVLPRNSDQVLVYHAAWAPGTPTFPIAHLQCHELFHRIEGEVLSPMATSQDEGRGDGTDSNDQEGSDSHDQGAPPESHPQNHDNVEQGVHSKSGKKDDSATADQAVHPEPHDQNESDVSQGIHSEPNESTTGERDDQAIPPQSDHQRDPGSLDQGIYSESDEPGDDDHDQDQTRSTLITVESKVLDQSGFIGEVDTNLQLTLSSDEEPTDRPLPKSHYRPRHSLPAYPDPTPPRRHTKPRRSLPPLPPSANEKETSLTGSDSSVDPMEICDLTLDSNDFV